MLKQLIDPLIKHVKDGSLYRLMSRGCDASWCRRGSILICAVALISMTVLMCPHLEQPSLQSGLVSIRLLVTQDAPTFRKDSVITDTTLEVSAQVSQQRLPVCDVESQNVILHKPNGNTYVPDV